MLRSAFAPLWLASLCLVAHWTGAAAWSTEGHERIARVANELMQGKHKDQIRTMLHGDLIALSDWEKTMTKKLPETDALHWHRQEPEWTCAGLSSKAAPDQQHLGDKGGHIKCDGHGAESGSLFCALAWFFEHFAHDALLNEYPKPEVPIGTPKTLSVLAKVPTSEQKPSHYLRWLSILIGDLHQPLHWLREKNYGRDIKVIYKEEEYTLLSFWEDYLPRQLAPMQSSSALKAESMTKHFSIRHKLPTELFRDWAKETAETVCNKVYGAMEINHADGTRQIDNPFKLSEEMYQEWLGIASTLTTQGGIRLAFVLQDIIEHKKHKAALKDGRGRHHRKKNWKASLGTNAAVAAVVVPLLLLGFRTHLNAGGPSLRRLMGQHMKT